MAHPDSINPQPLTQAGQQKAFTGEIEALVVRYRSEFELTLASMIGCLEVVKTSIMYEIFDEGDDE